VPGHVSAHDAGRQLWLGSVTPEGHERLLGLPLLVDIDAVGLDRVGRHHEVAAATGPRAWATAASEDVKNACRAPGRT
jgi:hypothetical protein